MLLNQRFQGLFGFLHLVLGRCRIDNRCRKHLAGRVNHGDFAACPVGGVDGQNSFALDGRLHQQRFEVDAEVLNRLLICHVGQVGTDFPLERRVNQPLIGVLQRGLHCLCGQTAFFYKQPAQQTAGKIRVRIDSDLEELLFFPAVDCQNPVARDFRHRLRVFIVHGINRFFLFCLHAV